MLLRRYHSIRRLQIIADLPQASAVAICFLLLPTYGRSATSELKGRIYSRTSKGPLASKAALWEEIARAAGYEDPYEVCTELLYDVAGCYGSLDTAL